MSWKTLRRALPWLVLAGSFAVLCVFEWRNITDLLDSDMASDMIYANLLAKEGSFFSPNWYYSSELRVFANHLSFTPLFLLTQDWRLVRGLGSMLTYALFVLSVYPPLRHTSLKRFYPLVAAAMLLPLSVTYFHYSFVGTSCPSGCWGSRWARARRRAAPARGGWGCLRRCRWWRGCAACASCSFPRCRYAWRRCTCGRGRAVRPRPARGGWRGARCSRWAR